LDVRRDPQQTRIEQLRKMGAMGQRTDAICIRQAAFNPARNGMREMLRIRERA
jgi:hypothetical protein